MVPLSRPGRPVGAGHKGVDLGSRQIRDDDGVEALFRDGEHALDEAGVFRVMQGRELEEGVDSAEAGVAGSDAVATSDFEVVEKPPTVVASRSSNPSLAGVLPVVSSMYPRSRRKVSRYAAMVFGLARR
jgi:hypothetical protein